MDEFGTYLNPTTVRIERRFPVSAEALWSNLTQPTLMEPWLAKAEIDLKPGGRVLLSYPGSELTPPRPGSIVEGKVVTVEPGHKLEFTYTEPNVPNSTVSFEVQPEGAASRLTLTHKDFPAPALHNAGAAWHTHMEILGAILEKKAPGDFGAIFGRVRPTYKERLPKA